MPSSEAPKQTLAAEFGEERLKDWKAKRARIAEASRIERQRRADAERQARLADLEAEKEQRLRAAAEERAAHEAAQKAERLRAARIRLASRADISSARKRLLAHRRTAWRRLLARVALCVGMPTIAVAAYLFVLATPLYEARTVFTLDLPDQVSRADAGLLAAPPGHREAYQVRTIMRAPQMLDHLDATAGITAHLGDDTVDPLSRFRAVPILQVDLLRQYHRFVDVTVNSQEGLLTLTTVARDQETAVRFADTILAETERTLATAGPDMPQLRVLSAPSTPDLARYPRRLSGILLALLGFGALFATVSIFVATLRRHAGH